MSWLGIDIGGANLKIADGNGYAREVSFPLWRQPEQLSQTLSKLITAAPNCERIAATMTGELADCFATKAEGVKAIVRALQDAAEGRPIEVYLCDGQFVVPEEALERPLLAAASNWHVLASFVTRFIDGPVGLLIDIGSTTCDVIPIVQGTPAAQGATDPQRLTSGELVYTGVMRSPVCAIVSELPWRGRPCRVAQELFASTQDVYVLLGEIAADASATDTADGRPRTKANAHARLARTICADTTMFSRDDALIVANEIRKAQVDSIAKAVTQVLALLPSPPTTIVLGGQGEFLACAVIEHLQLAAQVVSLNVELGTEISRSACAHALAVLARERALS